MAHKLDKEAQLLQKLTAMGIGVRSEKELAQESIVVVGLPDDGEPKTLVPGSKNDHKCCVCGIAVWLAPSGQNTVKLHPGNTVQCLKCIMKQVRQ